MIELIIGPDDETEIVAAQGGRLSRQRTCESEIVESRGTEVVYESADVSDRVVDLPAQPFDLIHHSLIARAVAKEVLRRVQTEAERSERWPDPVVQIASDPTPFVLAGTDEHRPGTVDLIGCRGSVTATATNTASSSRTLRRVH